MKKKRTVSILIFALAAYGKGISGGDRIFIEFAKRWSKKFPVTIYVWEEGYQMCKKQSLRKNKDLRFMIYDLGIFCRLGFLICYLARIVEGIRIGLTLKLPTTNYQLPTTIVYSASEFWMDSLPAFVLKIRFPAIKWGAAWYQTAPKPWLGRGSFFYWLTQLIVKPIILRFADFVLVNNDVEKKQFSKHNKNDKAIVVLGAVDLKGIKKFLDQSSKIKGLKYDAVFQGRFHPQKGVLELVDIWKKVVEKKPNAKLAMIGDGPLMDEIKRRITVNELTNNVILLGWLFDGPKKYKIFSQSKIVVHPAFYDSGGMAAAEAMTFGIPCVGFNLKSYESYYPKGMLKVKIGDLDAFSESVINLLRNEKLRLRLGEEARLMIEKNWSWDKRAEEVLLHLDFKR